jgi:hypothetical protein
VSVGESQRECKSATATKAVETNKRYMRECECVSVNEFQLLFHSATQQQKKIKNSKIKTTLTLVINIIKLSFFLSFILSSIHSFIHSFLSHKYTKPF